MSKAIKTNIDSVKEGRDQLIEDLKRVLEDVQNLTAEGKSASGDLLQKGAHAVKEEVENGMNKIHDLSDTISSGAECGAEAVGKSISNNPWRSVALAALAGLIIDRILPR